MHAKNKCITLTTYNTERLIDVNTKTNLGWNAGEGIVIRGDEGGGYFRIKLSIRNTLDH